MNDISDTIVTKSDQLNADDLIGGPVTIKILKVDKVDGEQPIVIHYEGDNGKPYKPGKSMRRVLVMLWGSDSKQYIGRYMTLYRDASISFGKALTGGIRISHMSNIEQSETIWLTEKRGVKKPFTVRPLVTYSTDDIKKLGEVAATLGMLELEKWWKSIGGAKQKELGAEYLDGLKAIAAKISLPPIATKAN